MRQFDINLGNNQRIHGEFKEGKHVIIFSHGFDVRRDSGGLFHDIAKNLPDGFGYVLFDYHLYEGVEENLRPLSEQASALHHVMTWTRNQLAPMTVHLVAHSMGCTIASYAGDVTFDTVTYLAPAMRSGSGLRRFFTGHPGATQKGEYWEIARRSGKVTRIYEKFFREFETANPGAFLKAYAAHKPLHIIYARQDKFIPEETSLGLKGIKGVTIEGLDADHNFTGLSRNQLISLLNKQLNPERKL